MLLRDGDWIGGKIGERSRGGLGATPERRADVVNRLAQGDRLGHEVGGEIGALGNLTLEPVGVFRRQRLGVLEPLGDMLGLAEMVLMRGKAATGFGVGEIERKVVGDQVQRTGARGRRSGRTNLHYDLDRLSHGRQSAQANPSIWYGRL